MYLKMISHLLQSVVIFGLKYAQKLKMGITKSGSEVCTIAPVLYCNQCLGEFRIVILKRQNVSIKVF